MEQKNEDERYQALSLFILRSTQLAVALGIQMDIVREQLFEKGIIDEDWYTAEVSKRSGDMLTQLQELSKQFDEESPDSKQTEK